MVVLNYTPSCRHCLLFDNNHIIQILHSEEEELSAKPEFEVMQQIEDWRNHDKTKCSFCGSSNVEVGNIKVNDYNLYDFKRLSDLCIARDGFMFQFNIDKRNDKACFNLGENDKISTSFLKVVLKQLLEIVITRPENFFEEHENGNFFICLVSDFNESSKEVIAKVECLKNVGISKNEILRELVCYAEQNGILSSLSLTKDLLLELDLPCSDYDFLLINRPVISSIYQYPNNWLRFRLPEILVNEIIGCVVAYKVDGYFAHLFELIAINDFQKNEIKIDYPQKLMLIYIKFCQQILLKKCQLAIDDKETDLPYTWALHHEKYAEMVQQYQSSILNYINYNKKIQDLLGLKIGENAYFDSRAHIFFQNVMYTGFVMAFNRIWGDIEKQDLFGAEILHIGQESKLIIYLSAYSMLNKKVLTECSSEDRIRMFNNYIAKIGLKRFDIKEYQELKTPIILGNNNYKFYYKPEFFDYVTGGINEIMQKPHITALVNYCQANYRQLK